MKTAEAYSPELWISMFIHYPVYVRVVYVEKKKKIFLSDTW